MENSVGLMETQSGDESLENKRRITYAELKKHATYADAWIAINGVVYDITGFIDKHPFGDTFRGSLGTECGGLFSSSHLNTNVERMIMDEKYLKVCNIKVVGRLNMARDNLRKNNDDQFLDRIVYQNTNNDNFWLELKTSVREYIRTNKETIHYTPFQGVMYLVYYSAIFVLLSYLTWIKGSYLAAALLGLHMVCAATNMAHMVTHFGFTRNKLLDFVAAHFFDLGGLSWLQWQIIHQTHHIHPSIIKPINT